MAHPRITTYASCPSEHISLHNTELLLKKAEKWSFKSKIRSQKSALLWLKSHDFSETNIFQQSKVY